MDESKIILPETKREIRPPELKEGIAPSEYKGLQIDLPEFDKGTRYGMWVEIGYEGWADSLWGMLEIFNKFIPDEYKRDTKFIVKPIKTIDGYLGFTIGWKYKPVFRDEMGGE